MYVEIEYSNSFFYFIIAYFPQLKTFLHNIFYSCPSSSITITKQNLWKHFLTLYVKTLFLHSSSLSVNNICYTQCTLLQDFLYEESDQMTCLSSLYRRKRKQNVWHSIECRHLASWVKCLIDIICVIILKIIIQDLYLSV